MSTTNTSRETVELFTEDEHAVLSAWLHRAKPDAPCSIKSAAAERVLTPGKFVDTLHVEATVAHILLESIAERLPQWARIDRDGKLELGRAPRDKAATPLREGGKVALQRWWQLQVDDTDQDAWATLTDTGLLDADTANELRNSVWPGAAADDTSTFTWEDCLVKGLGLPRDSLS